MGVEVQKRPLSERPVKVLSVPDHNTGAALQISSHMEDPIHFHNRFRWENSRHWEVSSEAAQRQDSRAAEEGWMDEAEERAFLGVKRDDVWQGKSAEPGKRRGAGEKRKGAVIEYNVLNVVLPLRGVEHDPACAAVGFGVVQPVGRSLPHGALDVTGALAGIACDTAAGQVALLGFQSAACIRQLVAEVQNDDAVFLRSAGAETLRVEVGAQKAADQKTLDRKTGKTGLDEKAAVVGYLYWKVAVGMEGVDASQHGGGEDMSGAELRLDEADMSHQGADVADGDDVRNGEDDVHAGGILVRRDAAVAALSNTRGSSSADRKSVV